MCITTSGVNGSLAWELVIGIYEPARKSKISRQKVLVKRQTTGISTFSGRQNVVWLLIKFYKSQQRKSTCLSDLNC